MTCLLCGVDDLDTRDDALLELRNGVILEIHPTRGSMIYDAPTETVDKLFAALCDTCLTKSSHAGLIFKIAPWTPGSLEP